MRQARHLAAVPALALLLAMAFGATAPAQTAPPNLAITEFGGPPCAEIGQVIGNQITITEINNGGAALPPPPGTSCVDQLDTTCSSIGFYISADAAITTSDTLLIGGRENLFSELGAGVPFNVGDTIVDFLFAGASVAAGSPTGNVYLGVIVDEGNSVAEAHEDDNTAALPILIVAAGSGGCGQQLPDLVVESLTHEPANPSTEEQVEFTAVVKNVGTWSSGPSKLCFEVGGESCALQPEITLFDVPALAAGESTDFIKIQTLEVAQDYLNTAIADYQQEVAESDEQNNTTTDSFTVTQATEPVALVYQITRLPEHGTLRGYDFCSLEQPCSLPGTTVAYEPFASFVGTDSFEFQVFDPRSGLTSLTIAPVGILVAAQLGFGVDLTVDFLGSGRGDVTMDVGGVVKAICDDDCTESFSPGQAVKLQARPIDEYIFAGWGGACNVTPENSQVATVTLPLSGGSSCTATFIP